MKVKLQEQLERTQMGLLVVRSAIYMTGERTISKFSMLSAASRCSLVLNSNPMLKARFTSS